MALAVFKMGPCKEGVELEETLFQSLGRGNKDLSQGLCSNRRATDGKDPRAIAEGPAETWRQILEPRMVFFQYRRK